MLEMLRYIAYIALNTCVKYCTKDQSNVKGVKGTLYTFQYIKCYVMVCMLKMLKMVLSKNVCVCSFPIFNIFDIHSITDLRYI